MTPDAYIFYDQFPNIKDMPIPGKFGRSLESENKYIISEFE